MLLRQRLRQVDAVDFGAEAVAEGPHVEHRHVGGIIDEAQWCMRWLAEASAMKLITWNTQWCCGLDGTVSPQRIVEGARALGDFDVLCLQEVAQGFDRLAGTPGDQPAQLAALLPGFQCFFGAAVDEFQPDGRRQRFGNLVATRLPVARRQHRVAVAGRCRGASIRARAPWSPCCRRGGRGARDDDIPEHYSVPQRLAQAQASRAGCTTRHAR